MPATCQCPIESPSQAQTVTLGSRAVAVVGLSLTLAATLLMAVVMVPMEAIWWLKDRLSGVPSPAQSAERSYPECD